MLSNPSRSAALAYASRSAYTFKNAACPERRSWGGVPLSPASGMSTPQKKKTPSFRLSIVAIGTRPAAPARVAEEERDAYARTCRTGQAWRGGRVVAHLARRRDDAPGRARRGYRRPAWRPARASRRRGPRARLPGRRDPGGHGVRARAIGPRDTPRDDYSEPAVRRRSGAKLSPPHPGPIHTRRAPALGASGKELHVVLREVRPKEPLSVVGVGVTGPTQADCHPELAKDPRPKRSRPRGADPSTSLAGSLRSG